MDRQWSSMGWLDELRLLKTQKSDKDLFQKYAWNIWNAYDANDMLILKGICIQMHSCVNFGCIDLANKQ
jgi:hypothetical protein